MGHITTSILAVLALGFAVGNLNAAEPAPINVAPRPSVDVPWAGTRPAITASPSDPAWASAATIDHLALSLGPDARELSAMPTRVQLLWDAQALYIRFTCVDDDIFTPFSGHDKPVYQGDAVEVFLDPVGDSQAWMELELAPNGAVLDQMLFLTAPPRSDANLVLTHALLQCNWWVDLGWNLEGIRTAATVQHQGGRVTGWIGDWALPAAGVLHRLGRKTFVPMDIRANLLRYDWLPVPSSGTASGTTTAQAAPRRTLVAMDWAPVIYGCPHISPQAMGTLHLIGPGHPP